MDAKTKAICAAARDRVNAMRDTHIRATGGYNLSGGLIKGKDEETVARELEKTRQRQHRKKTMVLKRRRKRTVTTKRGKSTLQSFNQFLAGVEGKARGE